MEGMRLKIRNEHVWQSAFNRNMRMNVPLLSISCPEC